MEPCKAQGTDWMIDFRMVPTEMHINEACGSEHTRWARHRNVQGSQEYKQFMPSVL